MPELVAPQGTPQIAAPFASRERVRIRGYAALFGVRDMSGEIVAEGAFAETLRGRDPRSVRMLFQHDPAQPLGVWEEIREDRIGLFVRGFLPCAVPKARDVAQLIALGALDGLSIGFRPARVRAERRGAILAAIDLWEVSVVTFPMMPAARVAVDI